MAMDPYLAHEYEFETFESNTSSITHEDHHIEPIKEIEINGPLWDGRAPIGRKKTHNPLRLSCT